ncbi:MAG: hypothetical protein KDB58_13380 [Solirubrobacterales bacterium]|nr:hypothetical protein [Solirubrobacterales bacterium]MCB8971749.1 hypothetical protein [Thermoleophilales bacterium]MCO5327971.1 hypothetical protein [Solirubrobacterales bacterium]
MIDAQATRQAALVPQAVLLLEVLGAMVALALSAGYLVLIGLGAGAVVLISALVGFLLFITADLDRPTRGLIKVPDTPLASEEGEMLNPPAPEPATSP